MVSKKGGGGGNSFLERKVSNRLSYTIIAVFAFILVGVGVYAVAPNPGHSGGQLDLSDGVNGNAVFNGKVGIGTSSPQTELHIVKADNTESGIRLSKISGPSTSFPQWTLSHRDNNKNLWLYGYDGSSFWNALKFDYDNKFVLVNPENPGGNVGIGTTSPGYKLDISGGAARIHSSSGADSLIFSEGPYSNAYRTKFRQTDRGDDAVDFDIWASDGIDVDTLVASFSNPSNSPRPALSVYGDLFVSGKITVGTTPGACNQDTAGELRYLNGYCSGNGVKKSQLEACMRTGVTNYAWQVIKATTWSDSDCAAAPPENPDTCEGQFIDCKA